MEKSNIFKADSRSLDKVAYNLSKINVTSIYPIYNFVKEVIFHQYENTQEASFIYLSDG